MGFDLSGDESMKIQNLGMCPGPYLGSANFGVDGTALYSGVAGRANQVFRQCA